MEQVDNISNNTLQQQDEEEEQEIWSWGAGTEGQLATGKLEDEHTPQFIRPLSFGFGPITSLSCGGAHAIALCPGGTVLTWGRATSGQLGHGDNMAVANCLHQPKQVEALRGFVITNVSAGWNHSAFVSENGALFTCGDGSFGQLGHGDYKSLCSPVEVSYFSSKHTEQVACGMRHSLVLVRDNEDYQVYGFGSGKRGQLGTSTDKVKTTIVPRITLGFTNTKIATIRANGDHSAALSADGNLYTWGRGFSSASDSCTPQRFNSSLSFDDVAVGWNHALLLTKEGEVFMLGGSRHGALGDPEKASLMHDASEKSKESINLQAIPDLTETKVLQIAAGAEHSALVTENGSVMTWGWGEHGQLGLGDTLDQTRPQIKIELLKATFGKDYRPIQTHPDAQFQENFVDEFINLVLKTIPQSSKKVH